MKKYAVAAIIVKDGNILLHQRHPHSRGQSGKWENAGGEIDDGETAETAIVREVKEELGVEFVPEKIVLNDDFTSDGITWNVTLFAGSYKGQPKIVNPKETINISWFPISELNSIDLASYTREDFKRFGWIK